MSDGPIIRKVSSLDDPELRPFRTLRRPVEHIREGIFVAEGEKVVLRLLESELPVLALLLTEEWMERLFDPARGGGERSRRCRDATMFVAAKPLVESIVGYNLHQGIMAVGRVPPNPALDSVMEGLRRPYFLVALDGLVNAENVGVVVRNCCAFGAGAIVVGETSSSPYLRRAVRNSMGAVFQISVVHVPDLAAALMDLRRKSAVRVIAAHPHEQAAIETVDCAGDICIVFGNEGNGISGRVLDACTARAAIPTAPGVDSLNVASAAAVFLYEVDRQRRAAPQSSPG